MWPIEDEDITIHQGNGTLTEYQFGRKYLTHLVRSLTQFFTMMNLQF